MRRFFSRRGAIPLLISFLAVAGISTSARGATGASETVAGSTSPRSTSKDRAIRLGASVQKLISQPFADTLSSGYGLAGSYEFVISPRFSLGLSTAFRRYPAAASMSQLGYGLLMKHYLSASERAPRPYLEYGLLLLVSRRAGVSGTGTSHDTRLAAGTELGRGESRWFVELAYHYSRLRFFDSEPTNLDFVESIAGVRLPW